MREIKFRGIALYGVDFICGSLLIETNEAGRVEYFIKRNTSKIQATEETVGQYTGLKDKNGVEIYEGDVCHIFTNDKTKIVFHMGAFGYWIWNNKDYRKFIPLCQDNISTYYIEVVGNIYQNQELL